MVIENISIDTTVSYFFPFLGLKRGGKICSLYIIFRFSNFTKKLLTNLHFFSKVVQILLPLSHIQTTSFYSSNYFSIFPVYDERTHNRI